MDDPLCLISYVWIYKKYKTSKWIEITTQKDDIFHFTKKKCIRKIRLN